jgi:hypothetical protein
MNTNRRNEILKQIRSASKDGKNVPWRESLPDITDGELDELQSQGFIIRGRKGYTIAMTGVGVAVRDGIGVFQMTDAERARVLAAISKCGETATVETILREARINDGRGRRFLRALQIEGRFHGYANS